MSDSITPSRLRIASLTLCAAGGSAGAIACGVKIAIVGGSAALTAGVVVGAVAGAFGILALLALYLVYRMHRDELCSMACTDQYQTGAAFVTQQNNQELYADLRRKKLDLAAVDRHITDGITAKIFTPLQRQTIQKYQVHVDEALQGAGKPTECSPSHANTPQDVPSAPVQEDLVALSESQDLEISPDSTRPRRDSMESLDSSSSDFAARYERLLDNPKD